MTPRDVRVGGFLCLKHCLHAHAPWLVPLRFHYTRRVQTHGVPYIRYFQLECVPEDKVNWNIPRTHYTAASRLLPTNGTPHNQMAVLATYQRDDLEGTYCYARSLLVANPCTLARNNLDMLFQTNEEQFRNILHERSQAKDVGTFLGASTLEKKKRTSDFALSFVRLQAILHGFGDMSDYSEIESSVFEDFMSLHDVQALDNDMVLKIIVVSIFTAHDLDAKIASGEANRVHLAVCFNYAVSLCFKLFDKLSILARGNESALMHTCVISEWLMHNLKYLVGPSPTTSEEGIENSKDLQGARLSFVQHMVDLLALAKRPGERTIQEFRALPEDVELMGFTPLSGAHQTLTSLWLRAGLVGEQSVAVERDASVARLVRLGRIEGLAQRLAAGSKALLFYDSQTGEYSVEGFGVTSSASRISTIGVHSQQRTLVHALVQGACVASVIGSMTEDGDQGIRNMDVQEADSDNNDTFGSGMMCADPPTDFSSLAQCSLAFANHDHVTSAMANAELGSEEWSMPQQEQEASDEQLEHLVGLAIASPSQQQQRRASVNGTNGQYIHGEDDMGDEPDEIILYKPPTSTSLMPKGEDSRSAQETRGTHTAPSFERQEHISGRPLSAQHGAYVASVQDKHFGFAGATTTPTTTGTGTTTTTCTAMWGGFRDALSFGNALMTAPDVHVPEGVLTWQAQPLIPSTGAQASLSLGSTELISGMHSVHVYGAGQKSRLSTQNPFVS
jgi:hypothetical protein